MYELYPDLLIALKKLYNLVQDDEDSTYMESTEGYNIRVTPCGLWVMDQTYNNRTLIEFSTEIQRSPEIRRNTIIAGRNKYYIPLLKNSVKYSKFDKDEYFNILLTEHLPTYEHIQFAFEVRKIFFSTGRYRSLTLHPKFIDLKRLKQTEFLKC